jgi:hypothetical protein
MMPNRRGVRLASNSVELRGFEPLTYSMRTSRDGPTWAFAAASSDGCATSPQIRGVGCDGYQKSAQAWRGFPARFLRDSRPSRAGQQTLCWEGGMAAHATTPAGANVKAVQRMLGHAKASMTLDVYADLFDTDLDAVAVELDAAIRAVAGKA